MTSGFNNSTRHLTDEKRNTIKRPLHNNKSELLNEISHDELNTERRPTYSRLSGPKQNAWSPRKGGGAQTESSPGWDTLLLRNCQLMKSEISSARQEVSKILS